MVSAGDLFLLWAYGVLLVSAAYVLIQRKKMKRMGSWTSRTIGGRRVAVRTDWNRCMGASSCVEIAPSVFRIDWEKKKSIFEPAPLQVLDQEGADPETIFKAALSCPYRAIILEDANTGDQIFPIA